MPLAAESERPQESRKPAVRLAIRSSADVALAEGRGALLGRLDVAEVAGPSVELGTEGLTAGHQMSTAPDKPLDRDAGLT